MFFVLAIAVAACADHSSPTAVTSPSSPAVRNVVLIVSDTMRRDRIGCYGGPAATPHLDRFAREHIRFDGAFTQAPWTKPSMATLFTSLYPSQHGVLSHPERQVDGKIATRENIETDILSEPFVTLAETLRDRGMQTAALVGNPWLDEAFGFSQGFEHYDFSFANWHTPGPEISQAALDWLHSREDRRPFFLYVHYMDCHRPWISLTRKMLKDRLAEITEDPRPLTPQAAQEIRHNVSFRGDRALPPTIGLAEVAYDQGLQQFDAAWGTLWDGLRQHPEYNQTAIIVVSDHGEALFHRGYGNHGQGLYNDEVAVPLAIRVPNVPAAVWTAPFGLVDLAPTICRWLDIAVPSQYQGVAWDLTEPVSEGRDCLVVEGVGSKPLNRAIIRPPFKLLWQPELGPTGKSQALFHLQQDPNETNDLFVTGPDQELYEALTQQLLEAASTTVPDLDLGTQDRVTIDPAVTERLRALGYIK